VKKISEGEVVALKASIEHWKKMCKWVKTQKDSKQVSALLMCEAINEEWYGDYCPLCIRHTSGGSWNANCKKCCLYKNYGGCDDMAQPHNKWVDVTYAETWKQWLKAARAFIKQLKTMLPAEE
jgi:hypothetical protein